jgi:hypothetical protein
VIAAPLGYTQVWLLCIAPCIRQVAALVLLLLLLPLLLLLLQVWCRAGASGRHDSW